MEKFKERTGIYHEHQIGSLCGQHAINNLLQSDLYSVRELADIAQELDKAERNVLTHTPFEPENMDETGFFSIQVLQQALKRSNIELVPFGSQEKIAKQARDCPQSIQAYICNLGLHWFTVRRFGRQYFNLNSFYYVPELVDDRILRSYINFILKNGYSVFIVNGELPVCAADEKLTRNPISAYEYETLTKDLKALIMDGKIIKDDHKMPSNGKMILKIPSDLLKAYKKNPNDPRIQEELMKYMPKDMADKVGFVGLVPPGENLDNIEEYSDLPMSLLDDFDDEAVKTCDCPHHRSLRQRLTERGALGLTEKPIESRNKPYVITRHITQLIVKQPNDDNTNEPSRKSYIIERQTLVQRHASDANYRNRQRNMIEGSGYENDDDSLLEYVLAESLRSAAAPPSDTNATSVSPKKRVTWLDETTEAASTTGATEGDSTTNQTKVNSESHETNAQNSPTNSSSATSVKIESTTLPNPLTTVAETVNSPPSTPMDSRPKPPIISSSVPMMDSDDRLLQLVLEESLHLSQTPDSNMSIYESITERYNQKSLEAAIAASLISSNNTASSMPATPVGPTETTTIPSSASPISASQLPIYDENNDMSHDTMAESALTAQRTNTDANNPLDENESETVMGQTPNVAAHAVSTTSATKPPEKSPGLTSTATNISAPKNNKDDNLLKSGLAEFLRVAQRMNLPLNTNQNKATTANVSSAATVVTPSSNQSAREPVEKEPISIPIIKETSPPTPSVDTSSSGINNSSPLAHNTSVSNNPVTFEGTPPVTVEGKLFQIILTPNKLRQRRLKFYGNRDRSIISQKSYFDD